MKLVAPLLVGLGLASLAAAAEKDGTFVPLVASQSADGTIPGWTSFGGAEWRLTDEGVLVCSGTPKGYLATEKAYRDFVLKLQWRWPPGKEAGHGGILIRKTGPDKIWPRSLEAQINAGDAGDFWGLDGYRLAGPAERMKEIDSPDFGHLTNLKKLAAVEKPVGEWNSYVVRAEGDKVSLWINGQAVNEATGCDVVAGEILLTAEGEEIHFRGIELAPLP